MNTKRKQQLTLISEVKKLIQEDKLESGLELLDQLFNSDSSVKELIFQKGRYRHLLRNDRLGILTYSELNQERNKIRRALIELIFEIEDEEYLVPNKNLMIGNYPRVKFIKSVIIAFSVFLILFFIWIKDRRLKIQTNKIARLDQEIAERIKNIDIVHWHKVNLDRDTLINLPNILFLPPEKNKVLYEEFSNDNFKSLLYELKDELIEEKEKQDIKRAILKFEEIQERHIDLSFDPKDALEFYINLVELNSIRWTEFNEIDERDIQDIGKQLLQGF